MRIFDVWRQKKPANAFKLDGMNASSPENAADEALAVPRYEELRFLCLEDTEE